MLTQEYPLSAYVNNKQFTKHRHLFFSQNVSTRASGSSSVGIYEKHCFPGVKVLLIAFMLFFTTHVLLLRRVYCNSSYFLWTLSYRSVFLCFTFERLVLRTASMAIEKCVQLRQPDCFVIPPAFHSFPDWFSSDSSLLKHRSILHQLRTMIAAEIKLNRFPCLFSSAVWYVKPYRTRKYD